ncbi:MAG: hypothetical protein DBO99_07990 [gamma proteobacterium symbiont of Ctena orbiculata]|nr:MAG: hypothetical protein DBO99_07990 [gamma proteobacterium symbiont of Ctena orbiculata]
MKYPKIKPCKGSQFISNLQEISNYFAARKKLPVITNTTRLINVIKVYFETLLFYLDNSPNKFYVNIGDIIYESKINAHSTTGEPLSLDLEDISEQFVGYVTYDLAKTMNPRIFIEYIKLLNGIILTKKVAPKHIISIINGENKLPNDSWYTLIRQLPEKLATEAIEIRKDFIFKAAENTQLYLPGSQNRSENLLTLHKAYELYIKTLLRIHIYHNHFDEIFSTITNSLNELTERPESEFLDKRKLIGFLLTQLVLNNNLFQIERKDNLREFIQEYSEYIKDDISDVINDALNFEPDNFEIRKLCIDHVEPDFSMVKIDEIQTVISFVVPYVAEKDFIKCDLDDKAEIYFSKVTNVFEDPIYSFLDSTEKTINGMPLTFFSDSIGNIGDSTRIDIVINEFYHPDFEIVENKIVPIDFEKEEAKRGGRYFPHKDIVIDLLWELQSNDTFPLQIERLDSEFISNYLVSYLDNDKLVHHKLFIITNFNSYFAAKNRFYNNLNTHYMADDIPEIRSYILDTRINCKKFFSNFCYRLLEITLKKSIEFGGLNDSFWEKCGEHDTPILERKAQPIIYNQLRFLVSMKGITLSREVIASNGSLDFHFSYTKNDVLMNVCVELKNAHHPNLKHGITTQLPLYIKDVGSREGIFLVLWYKSDKFNKPTAYADINELELVLSNIAPKKYKIKSLIIDCSPKASPSLKLSGKRLEQE